MTGDHEILHAQIEAMPRVRFVWERDWLFGADVYAAGILWDRNFDAEPGEFVYRRRIILRLKFRLWLERC
jgi:hypothetical protein